MKNTAVGHRGHEVIATKNTKITKFFFVVLCDLCGGLLCELCGYLGCGGLGTMPVGSGQFPSYGGQFGTASSGAG